MAGHANYLATFGTKGVRILPLNKGSQGIYNAFFTLYGSNHLVFVVATTSCCCNDQAEYWPSSSGLRGGTKTYLTIFKRAWSANLKWYGMSSCDL
jgi:hypothetical protein